MRRKTIAITAACVVATVAAAGGGWIALRRGDPVQRAEQSESRGDLRTAQLEWRAAIAKAPRDPAVHVRLARVLLRLYDPYSAEKEVRAAASLGADRWTLLPLLAEAYVQQERWRTVLTDIPRAAPTPEVTARLLMARAIAHLANNDVGAATTTLAAAEAAAPGRLETLLIAARVALAREDMAAAGAKLDAALALAPGDTDALLLKLQLVAATGDRAATLALADRTVASSPFSPLPRLDRANQFMQAGDDARARADLDTVLGRWPNLPGAIFLNGLLLARAGKLKDADLAFSALRPNVDRYPRALYVHALVASRLGNVETALDMAQRYNARFPADRDGVLLLANTQLAARRPDLAVPLLEKAYAAGQDDPATLDLLGTAYLDLGDSPGALRIRQQAAALAPGDPDVLTRLGQLQLQQGDTAAAIATLERSAGAGAATPDAAEALVLAALSAGELDRAQAALDRFRAQRGDSEAAGLLQARLLLARNDIEGARAAFLATAKAFPDSTAARVGVARILLLTGLQAEGEAILRDILAGTPADMPALVTELQVRLRGRQYPLAIQALEKARAAAPGNPLFPAMLADLLVRAGEPARAIAMLQGRRAAGGTPAILLGALARAQAAANQRDAAIASYGEQLALSPSDLEARRAQVALLLQAERLDDARASLQAGLSHAPGTLPILSALVALQARTGGLESALKLAATLRQDAAQMPAAALLQGDILLQARQFDPAARAFAAEFERAPSALLATRTAQARIAAGQDDAGAEVLRRWLGGHPGDADAAAILARLDVKARRWDDAQRNLETVLASRPDDAVSLNNLAWIYQSKNDPRARATAQRAYLQAPNPQVADTLGWILVQQGEARAAVPILRRALDQKPGDVGLTQHLAVALRDDGQRPAAVTLLQGFVAGPAPLVEKQSAMLLLQELTAR